MGNSQVFRPGGALFPRNTHSHSSGQSHEDGCTRRQFKTRLLLLGPLHKSKEDNSQPSRGSPPLPEPNAVPPLREMKKARTIRNMVPKLQAEAKAEKEEQRRRPRFLGNKVTRREELPCSLRLCPLSCFRVPMSAGLQSDGEDGEGDGRYFSLMHLFGHRKWTFSLETAVTWQNKKWTIFCQSSIWKEKTS